MTRTGIDPEIWLRHQAERLDDRRREAIVADVVEAVIAGVPELGDPEVRPDLRSLAEDCLRSLEALADAADGHVIELGSPTAGFDLCRTLARRGLDAGVIFRLFRTGHTHFWHQIMQTVRVEIDDPDQRMEVLATAWSRLSSWMDAMINRLVSVHQAERDGWLRGALARRAEIVGALLRDEPVDAAAAATTLGHDLQRWQTAFIVRAAARDAADQLERTAEAVARALGAKRALTVPSGARALWGWVATPVPVDLQRLSAIERPEADVRVAVGRSGLGPDGFRRSHAQAAAAQRAAIARREETAVTSYADVELVALVSAEPEATHAFLTECLRDLGAPTPRNQRLRETAATFLRCNANASACARALGVHRNTVRNRVLAAERLLGTRLDPGNLPLHLALHVSTVVDVDRLPRPTRSA